MLFDTHYFEQFIKEAVLKKGFALFEAGHVEFIEKHPGNEFNFLVNKTAALTLRKRGDKLTSYSCSCKKTEFCEHLAAVLFYFQQDTLGLAIKKRTQKRSATTVKTAYDFHVEALREWLKPYLNSKALNQAQLDELCKEVIKLKSATQHPGEAFDLNLAMLTTLPAILQLRLLGNESQLKTILHVILKELKLTFDKGLDVAQQQKWFKATLESIRNNAVLKSEAYTFLIPAAVNFITSKPDLERLMSLLGSRKYKMDYASRFDKLMIAKLEVALKGSELFNLSFPADYATAIVELIIAKAELYFYSNNSAEAFNYLAESEEPVRQQHFYYYSAYVDYAIGKAREERKPFIELGYLKKSFIYNPFILPKYLERFMELVPASDIDPTINELIAWLKNKPGENTDKITDLLLSTGRLDELIDELKKQNNKFNLLHTVLLKKLPYYDTELLELYRKHLLEAFTEAGFYHFQQHIFNKANMYLNRLPEKIKADFISELLDAMGRNKQISRYVLSL